MSGSENVDYKDVLVTSERWDVLRDATQFAIQQADGERWGAIMNRTMADMLYAYADGLRAQILGDTGYLPEGDERASLIKTLELANEMLGPDALDMTPVSGQDK